MRFSESIDSRKRSIIDVPLGSKYASIFQSQKKKKKKMKDNSSTTRRARFVVVKYFSDIDNIMLTYPAFLSFETRGF